MNSISLVLETVEKSKKNIYLLHRGRTEHFDNSEIKSKFPQQHENKRKNGINK